MGKRAKPWTSHLPSSHTADILNPFGTNEYPHHPYYTMCHRLQPRCCTTPSHNYTRTAHTWTKTSNPCTPTSYKKGVPYKCDFPPHLSDVEESLFCCSKDFSLRKAQSRPYLRHRWGRANRLEYLRKQCLERCHYLGRLLLGRRCSHKECKCTSYVAVLEVQMKCIIVRCTLQRRSVGQSYTIKCYQPNAVPTF